MGRPKGSKNKPKTAPIEQKVQVEPVKKKVARKPKSAQPTAQEQITELRRYVRNLQTVMNDKDFKNLDCLMDHYWYHFYHPPGDQNHLEIQIEVKGKNIEHVLYIVSNDSVYPTVHVFDKVQLKKINEKKFELIFTLKGELVHTQVYSF